MKRISVIITLSILLFCLNQRIVRASGLLLDEWSPPQPISDPGKPAYQPDITSDPYGHVHVVWVQSNDKQSGCNYDAVMYSDFTGDHWTNPVDIMVSPYSPYCAGEPAITYSSKDNRLYIIWTDYRLYFSSADANQANSVKAWTPPVVVDDLAARRPDIVVDHEGRIHIVYYRDQPYWQIYYTRSDDGGLSWTIPMLIHTAQENRQITRPVIVLDNQDRLHLVWCDELKDGINQRGGTVYYTRSMDGGFTWDTPIIVDDKNPDYTETYGAGEIDVTTSGDDQVFLTWAGPPSSQRWYQWSADGGATWFIPKMIAPINALNGLGLRNYNEGMDMAVDSSGRIHLVTSGSGHLTHVMWENGSWYEPDILLDYETIWPRIAIRNGNELFVVYSIGADLTQTNPNNLMVWIMRQTINSPLISPINMETSDTPEPAITSIVNAAATVNPIKQPIPTFTDKEPNSIDGTGMVNVSQRIIVVSIVPIVIIFIIVIALKRWKVGK